MSLTFSVVIPTYNRAAKLARALDSLDAQTVKPMEILIVDDGDTDETPAMIAARHSPSLIYIRQNNAGPAAARQRGREAATGDVIVYLDSDDTFFPHALANIAVALEAPDKAYGLTAHRRVITLIDANGHTLKTVIDDSGMADNLTPEDIYAWKMKTTSSGVFHRADPRYTDIRWRSGVWIEDWEFMLQLIEADPAGFAYVPQPCLEYVQVYGGDGLCSNARYADFAHAFSQIYEWHKNDRLMTDPSVFLDRVRKYTQLQVDFEAGKALPPHYKYFPEFWPGN